MNNFKLELKIIAEDMAKLYEHTDKIVTIKGEILVDVEFNITEEQVDITLIKRIQEVLHKYEKSYTEDELSALANSVTKEASKRVNDYRKEKGIKKFKANDIER